MERSYDSERQLFLVCQIDKKNVPSNTMCPGNTATKKKKTPATCKTCRFIWGAFHSQSKLIWWETATFFARSQTGSKNFCQLIPSIICACIRVNANFYYFFFFYFVSIVYFGCFFFFGKFCPLMGHFNGYVHVVLSVARCSIFFFGFLLWLVFQL